MKSMCPLYTRDKNFAYYRENIHTANPGGGGKELVGFFGSSNLKHDGAILGCAFSPDGKMVVSASDDTSLKLWETKSGRIIKSLDLPWTPVFISISPKNTNPDLVITANRNGTLTLFDFSDFLK